MPPNRICYHEFLNGVSNLPEKRNYKECKNQFVRVFNKHAPLKSKVIRDNNEAFITKAIIKAIMRRSASKKKVDNSNDLLATKLCNREGPYVVNFSLRKTTFRNIASCHTF